jgi:DNA (cytosine-5)-methyltransferase 1
MNAIDLFCGVGGMSLGFKRAGFNILASFDFELRHTQTYSYNFNQANAITADIRQLDAAKIREYCKPNQQIDIVFGGPPCQGFSVAGKGMIEDERNSLLLEFARLVCDLKPKTFVAENVTGILSKKFSNLVAIFYETMSDAGYRLIENPWVLDASNYGVPQRRKRVFFIGVLENACLPSIPVSISYQLEGLNATPTVKDAIGDLPMVDEFDYLLKSDRYLGGLGQPSEYAKRLREEWPYEKKENQHRPNFEGLGGCARTNHSKETKERFKDTRTGTMESVSRFYRLDWQGLAPTLRAGTPRSHGQHMAARPIHPEESRCITVREGARLHSFPDWFEFYPTKWYGFMQIGNSVPPYLAEAVANSLRLVLS